MPGLGKLRRDGGHHPWSALSSDISERISSFFQNPSHESTTAQPPITAVANIPSSGAPSNGATHRDTSRTSVGQQSTVTTQVPSSFPPASASSIAPNDSPSSTYSGFSSSPEVTPAVSSVSSTSSITHPASIASSFAVSILPTSVSTSSESSGSPTPIAAPPTSNANPNRLIIAIIVISILVLLASIALGIRYFFRRRRQRRIALSSRVNAVAPSSATMNEIRVASRGSVSSMMTSESVASSETATIIGLQSEPNRFASSPASPARLKLVTYNVLDVDTSSQAASDLKHPDVVIETAAVASPAPSSRASFSFNVPFPYNLRAMRRRGELRKTPAIEPHGIGYTDSDTDSTRLTRHETGIYSRSLTASRSDHVGTVSAI